MEGKPDRYGGHEILRPETTSLWRQRLSICGAWQHLSGVRRGERRVRRLSAHSAGLRFPILTCETMSSHQGLI